jgi:hypothetical protein
VNILLREGEVASTGLLREGRQAAENLLRVGGTVDGRCLVVGEEKREENGLPRGGSITSRLQPGQEERPEIEGGLLKEGGRIKLPRVGVVERSFQ